MGDSTTHELIDPHAGRQHGLKHAAVEMKGVKIHAFASSNSSEQPGVASPDDYFLQRQQFEHSQSLHREQCFALGR